jgi:hypothetical protein
MIRVMRTTRVFRAPIKREEQQERCKQNDVQEVA